VIIKEDKKHIKQLTSPARILPDTRNENVRLSRSNENAPHDLETAIDNLTRDSSFVKTLVDNIPDPILITQLDSSIKYVNPALEKLTGYSRSELIGLKDPYPWWPSEMVKRYEDEGVEGKKRDLNELERSFRKKNGERFHVNIKIQALRKDKRIKYYLAVWEDLTERKLAEKKVAESETNYRNLFQSMAQGVIYFDNKGKVLSANPAACGILGLTLEQMLGQSITNRSWTLFDENKVELIDQAIPALKALTTGQVIKNILIKVRIPERGDDRWLVVDAVPEFLSGEKQAYRVFAMLRDITERIRAQENLKNSYEKLQIALQSSVDVAAKMVEKRDPYTPDISGGYQTLSGNRQRNAITG
jgi:PAS domain S-box-containing protein